MEVPASRVPSSGGDAGIPLGLLLRPHGDLKQQLLLQIPVALKSQLFAQAHNGRRGAEGALGQLLYTDLGNFLGMLQKIPKRSLLRAAGRGQILLRANQNTFQANHLLPEFHL